ncbi:MAG: toxin TcdB middle/N-terminal domain-containing protein, partial [Polyangiaceae bacterium]
MLIRLGQMRAPIALCTLTVFVASLSFSTRAAAQQAEPHAPVADVEEAPEVQLQAPPQDNSSDRGDTAEPRGKSAAQAVKIEDVEQSGVDKEQLAKAAEAKSPEVDAEKEAAALTSGEDKSGVTSSAISVPKGSGTVQGMEESFSAQLSTGIATYSVGFALPTARGGIQPSLGLSYSSSGGHGTAGVGWNVGVSFIARQTDRGLPKYNSGGQFTPDQDRFVFNGGQELVPICDVTSARECDGALPGEVMPEWSPGWQYHRPRVEGGFMRFFWSPDGLTWRVQSKDGSTLELGVALDGKKDRQAIEANPEKPEEVYRWNLRREFDTYHDGNGAPVNVAYYGYTHDGATAYLSDIYDTSPADDPTGYLLSSGTALDFSRFAHHTHLVWEERSDPTFSYRSGWRMEQNLRIARVDVTSASYGNEARELVRRYLLDYDSSYHVSLLSAVTLQGRCQGQTVYEGASGELPRNLSCEPDSLPPTRFDYSHVGPAFDGFEPFDDTVREFLSSPSVSVDEGNTDLFDINSDGLPDVLATAGSPSAEHRVFFNGANGELTSFGSPEPMAVDGLSGLPLSSPNVVPLDLDGDGRINLLHMPKAKQYSVLSPELSSTGWVWRNRTVTSAGDLSSKIDFTEQGLDTKVVDVDFDGLVDLVVSSGTSIQTFFALGRYPGGDGKFGTGCLTGKNEAEFEDYAVEACVPRNGNIVLFSQPDVFLADMNGDGINDIVRMRSGDVKYWPGRGNGFWGTGDRDDCKPGDNAEYRSLAMDNPPTLQGDTQLRLDDVNGDGLSDIIQVRSKNVDIWINVDGKGFKNRRILFGTPDNPSNRSIVRIADVDGSGTRDIVWGDGGEYRYIDLQGGTRPWVLTEVRSGLGKTTTLEYTSSIDEMLQAERDGQPWAVKAPMALHLVKRMSETDNLNVYGQGSRTYSTEYTYRDPVYDGRQREFRGFRVATSKAFGDANSPTSISRSTFLLGECLLDNGEPCPDNETWLDNPHEALKGLPVLSETYDEHGVYLSTSHNEYTLRRLYEGMDGRGVVYAFSNASTAWAYDTGHFIPSSTRLKDQPTVTAEGVGVGPSITTEIPLRATSGTVRTYGDTTVDDFGNQLTGTSYGCVSGCPAGGPDEAITGVSEPVLLDHPSGWLWRTASSYTIGSVHTERRGETATSYTEEGNPDLVAAVLTGTEELQRFHETAGAAVAPTPGDAVSDSTALYVGETDYDQFGNAIRSYGPGGRCADVYLDPLYAQLATTERMYPSGCPATRDNPPPDTLYSAASYDRGLELVTYVIDLTFQTTKVEYDGLGRLTHLFRSEPNGATVGTTPSVEISYDLATEGRRYSIIHTRSQDGPTTSSDAYMDSYAYIDGMGRTLAAITEADPSANDEGRWIAGGYVEYDKKGAVSRKHLPKFWDGEAKNFDPEAAPGTPFGRVEYDAFGRDLRLYDLDDTQTLRKVYHALSSDAWDAADFDSAGPHAGTYATSVSDGQGRGVLGIERFKEDGTLIERQTRTTYLPTGEPISITRSSASGSTTRWLRYDSLGRMVLNVEPHTSVNFDPGPNADASNIKAWRYRYNASGELIGTSDARGCGVNFAYDGVGRLVYEDYSPCEAHHQAYSPPSENGGVEVYYHYDSLPPSALGVPEVPNGSNSTDTFTLLSGGDFLRGKLVAVFDRAKTTWTNYDGRSRAFESWVRLAAPGVPDDTMADRFAGRWYRKQVSFDGADRVVSETTGAQSPELMGSDGQSHVDIAYSNRGTVKSVGGSYGELVTDIKRTADGLHEHIEYGDLARTRTQFAYDTRRRLATVQTYRGPPAAWSDPSSSYSHAGIGTDTFQKVLQDDHYHYDVVGNPWKIEDLRNPDEWPAGAKPVTRTMQYDDLYRVNRVDYGYTERDDSVTQPTPTPNPWGLGPSGSRTHATPRISAADLARFHQESAKSPSLAGVQPKSAAQGVSGGGVTSSGAAKLPPPPPPPAPVETDAEPQAKQAEAPAATPKAANLQAERAVNRAALDAAKLPDVSQVPAPSVTAITNQSPSGALTAPYVFTWTGVSDATGYNFRIYDGEGYHFDREVSVADLGCSGGGTCTFDLANASPAISLGQGAARWNVRIVGGSDDGDWASWVNVSVGNVEPLTASTMTAPPSVVGAPFIASWTGSLGASHYVFDMRRVSDNVQVFGQTRQKYEVCTGTNCSITFQPSATGDYTIRIQSNSEHNLNGPWSNTLSFHEDVEGPRPITPAGLTPDFSGYSFTHRASLIQYRIRWVAQDGTSHEATNNPACGVSGVCTYNWTRTLPNGGAVWAVQGGFGGGVWTPYVWQDIAFGSSLPTLSAPTLASPTAHTGYFGKLYWEPTLGISGYDIEVLDGSGTLLESYSLTKAELRCDNPDTHDLCEFQPADQSVGDYQWRVRAVGLDSAPGPWSPTTAFSITTSPAPPVGPLTPNTLIGAGAAGSTDTYRWSSAVTGQYRAQLFTTYGGTPTETTPVPAWAGCSDLTTCYYGMPRPIAEGGAVWGVQYHLGSPGMWSAYQWQDIAFGDSYPTLAAPIQYEPAGLVGSPVTPKWKPEVGVRSYDFELFDGSGNPLTAAQYTKKELGCDNPTSAAAICKPAAITLGIGSYSWRVRARGLDDAPGPWSASLAFTIDEDGPTPVAPAGEVTGQPPVFRWTPRSGVVQYHLRVWDGDGGLQQLYILPSNAGCANNAGICQTAPWYTIPQGAAYWEVRGGFSIYADTGWRRQNFSIGPITPFQTPVQLSPSGLVGAPFDLEWEFDSAAAKYAVSVKTPGGTEVYSTVKARTELSCGVLGSTCTLQDVSIPSGNYIWYIRPLNAQGTLGPWSSGMAFEVDGAGPTPVWPNADIPVGDDTPTYRFTTVAGATQYQWKAQLSDGSVPPIGYIDPATACDGGYCEYEPAVPLPTGAHRWWVRAKFADNSVTAWKDTTFSYGGYIPLGLPDRIAPKGVVSNPFHPVWSRDPGATWYDLWFKDASNTQIYFQRLHRDAVGCGNGEPTCTGPEFTYAPGDYSWFIASVNPWNRGAISLAEPFTVQDLPSAPTILAPIGNLHDSVPVYSWTSQGGVTSYELRVQDSTGGEFTWTFTPSEASCSPTQCDVTPAQVLTPGSYTVWVQAENSYGKSPWSQPEQFYLVPSLTDQDDTWDDPNADPSGEHRRAEPSPYQEFENRIRYQTWNYDWLGNTTDTDDDAKGFYDRSLGTISNGPVGGKAYQLNSASNRGNSGTKEGDLSTTYDVTGNLTDLYLHRDGQCVSAGAGCNQYFHYEWDEVGRLVTAKRWDQNVASGAQPTGVADVELHYGYDASDMRVSKRAVDTAGEESYTLYIFGS